MQSIQTKKGATKDELADLETAKKVKEILEAGKDIRHADWTAKEVPFLNQSQFISAKPVVYLVNMSEKDFLRKKNKHLPKVMEYVKENGGDAVIPYSAAFEQGIFELPEEEQQQARLARRAACCSAAYGHACQIALRTSGCASHQQAVMCTSMLLRWCDQLAMRMLACLCDCQSMLPQRMMR